MSFNDLELHPSVLKAVEESGYVTPTDIQKQAIPKILEGFDLKASAQTGSGKTAAFMLPTLTRLMKPQSGKNKGPRALILVPTRELAMQVATEAAKYASHLPQMRTVCIYGGAPYPIQNRQLSRPYEILVATPGRLMDHLERGRIDLSQIELLILDEADRMLDMGFILPVEHIAKATPKSRQTLLFSATFQGKVFQLAKNLLKDPLELNVAPEHLKQTNIEQRLFFLDSLDDKFKALDHLLKELPINQAIIFTSTKRLASELVDILCDKGHSALALHGDMNQRQRTSTINQMRRGSVQLLVATDVAARGIDVQTISHIFNFDLPMSAEDYVHRIGRTGRAGAKGFAFSFALPRDFQLVRGIERYTGHKIVIDTIPGIEPKKQPLTHPPKKKPFGRFDRNESRPSQNRGSHKESDRSRSKKSSDRAPWQEKSFNRDDKPRSDRAPWQEKSFNRDDKPRSEEPSRFGFKKRSSNLSGKSFPRGRDQAFSKPTRSEKTFVNLPPKKQNGNRQPAGKRIRESED